MTEQAIRALVDQDLSQVIGWAEDELRMRADKRKHDTLAKIKELAGAAAVLNDVRNPERYFPRR